LQAASRRNSSVLETTADEIHHLPAEFGVDRRLIIAIEAMALLDGLPCRSAFQQFFDKSETLRPGKSVGSSSGVQDGFRQLILCRDY